MFYDLYYHKDTQLLPALARSLWSLMMVLGSAKNVITVGKHSKKLIDMTDSMKGCPNPTNQLGGVIIMDRTCDLPPLLLTPVTYLGLMSEVFDIKTGVASLNSDQIKLDPKKDLVYAEVRDRHFSDAFPTFRAKAKSLKCIFSLFVLYKILIFSFRIVFLIFIYSRTTGSSIDANR